MKHEVIDDSITRDEHNWTLQSLHRLSGRELTGGPYTLRVVVKRNAYDFQSYATIQVWSGRDHPEWKEVWTLPRSQMHVLFSENGRPVVPYVAQVLSKEAEDAFHADEAALLSMAKDILS